MLVGILSAELEPPLLDEDGRTLGEKDSTTRERSQDFRPADLAQNHDHYLHGTTKK